jgi:general secretion pathway protein H
MDLPTDRNAGFTLLELIIVLVIMGLMIGLVAASDRGVSPRLATAASARDIALALRDAGSRAIAEDRETRFVLDPQHGFWREGARRGTVPRGIVMTFQAIASAGTMIVFAPDGSCSGGQIRLAGSGVSQIVTAHWLTGRIGVDDGGR